jgi:translation initiation factor 6 (eIF-6)
MSIAYHKELFNNGKVKLMVNFGNIKGDVADENLTLNFYAVNSDGIPIFTESLNIKDVRSLYNHLGLISIIKDGNSKSSKFIETSDEINLVLEKLESKDLDVILQLLEKFESEEKIRGLLESLSDLEIVNLHGAFQHKLITEEIKHLEKLIELEVEGSITSTIDKHEELLKYKAGQPEKIFQNWIESNLWIFGIDYIKKHDVRKVALFSEGDLLMESVDGYLDLIELKRPNHELFKFDNSHKCFYPHTSLSQVIGQSLFYLQKLQDYKLVIEKEYKVKVIMPRVKIIIGRNNNFKDEEKDSLRMLNSNLSSIQIITYNDLVQFGKLILESLNSSGKACT